MNQIQKYIFRSKRDEVSFSCSPFTVVSEEIIGGDIELTLGVGAGADLGTFDLYSDLDGYTTNFNVSPITRQQLLDTHTSSLVPSGATIIRITSTGDCTNSYDSTIDLLPTSGIQYIDNGGIVGALTSLSINVPYPSTVNEGDFLIFSVYADTFGLFTRPSGWTIITEFQINSGARGSLIMYKIADGTETGTLAVPYANSTSMYGIMSRFSGVEDTTSSHEQLFTTNVISDTSLGLDQANNTLGTDRLAICIFLVRSPNVNNLTSPTDAGWVQEFSDNIALGSGFNIVLATKPMPLITTSAGEVTVAISPANLAGAISVYLIPN